MKTKLEKLIDQAVKETVTAKWGCPVCGMDEWCGTDGCPRDPQ